VADEEDVPRIGPQRLGIRSIPQIRDRGLRILDRIAERKRPRRSPGPPVVEVEDIVSGPAQGLRQVKVALVSGEAVQKDNRRMRTCTGCDIDERIEI